MKVLKEFNWIQVLGIIESNQKKQGKDGWFYFDSSGDIIYAETDSSEVTYENVFLSPDTDKSPSEQTEAVTNQLLKSMYND